MKNEQVNSVLLPVDGSEHSRRSLRVAASLVNGSGGTIIVVYVRHKIADIIGEPFYQKVLDRQMDEAESILAFYKSELTEAEIKFETLILEGDPAQAIITCAEVEKSDIIVMGTRGLSDLAGLVLGSVSHKVVHASKIPVLLVP